MQVTYARDELLITAAAAAVLQSPAHAARLRTDALNNLVILLFDALCLQPSMNSSAAAIWTPSVLRAAALLIRILPLYRRPLPPRTGGTALVLRGTTVSERAATWAAALPALAHTALSTLSVGSMFRLAAASTVYLHYFPNGEIADRTAHVTHLLAHQFVSVAVGCSD